MPININPNRINIPAGNAGKLAERKRGDSLPAPTVPKRADVGIIPEPESLATLIRSAIESLRRGITWDRGTILNLVV